MTHREAIKQWQSTINLKDQNVIDWGSGAKPSMRYINHENCEFTTVDKNPLIDYGRRAVKHIEADITEPKDYGKFDTAFCIEVLEHVKDPFALMRNIATNLEEGGVLYITAPFKLEIHSDEDYWRYTEQGLQYLLEYSGFGVREIKTTVDELGYMAEAVKL